MCSRLCPAVAAKVSACDTCLKLNLGIREGDRERDRRKEQRKSLQADKSSTEVPITRISEKGSTKASQVIASFELFDCP